MKYSKLTTLNFMALCCVLGLFTKKLINPFANVITDALHIPGGVSTAFSIMFLVIGQELVRVPKGGTLMTMVQGLLALVLGRVGSMGILMPLGYIVTGIAIDLIYGLEKKLHLNQIERMIFANALAAVMASAFANLVVFRLRGPVLLLYLCVSLMSGTAFGYIASIIAKRLKVISR